MKTKMKGREGSSSIESNPEKEESKKDRTRNTMMRIQQTQKSDRCSLHSIASTHATGLDESTMICELVQRKAIMLGMLVWGIWATDQERPNILSAHTCIERDGWCFQSAFNESFNSLDPLPRTHLRKDEKKKNQKIQLRFFFSFCCFFFLFQRLQ